MTTLPPSGRIASIDILRGMVMVIMALDHVREFFHAQALAFDPLDPQQSYPALYATRWITHFCAPVFVFLSGVSAYLQAARGKPKAKLSVFLLTRGLWLLFLELTVIGFGWNFRLDFIFLQVIWAIGVSMIVLSGLVWLPARAVLLVGAAILAGHHLLDPVTADQWGVFAFLHEQTPIIIGGEFSGFIIYPLIPWIGLMAFGYGFGEVFTWGDQRRRSALFLAGAAMVLTFAFLRFTELYGDANRWGDQGAFVKTAMDFLSTTKYPPSLLFVLMTIGPALMLLPALERFKGAFAEPWLSFGAVPFFFYVLHIYLAHGLSAIVSAYKGHPVWGVADIFRRPEYIHGPDYSLSGTWIMWVAVVAILYLPCRWFAKLKREKPGGWLSYL